MMNYKKLICTSVIFVMIGTVMAQTSTNSPYTRYGLGQLADQSFGNGKAMGGIGYGLRSNSQINVLNPASYSAVDSLTFLMDTGVTLQNANFSERGIKTNAKNSSFDYLAVQFRLLKGFGLTAGFLPFSTTGYNLSSTSTLKNRENNDEINVTNTFYGDGGIHQVFLGAGYNFLPNLSIGANLSYIYGDITHSIVQSYSTEGSYNSVIRDEISVNDIKLDFGLQYSYDLNKKDKLNMGLIYSLGHDLNSTGKRYQYITSSSTVTPEAKESKDVFSLPQTIGAGLTYVHDNKLTLGLDYTFQNWSDAKYFNEKNYYSNLSKIAIGCEYVPDKLSSNYLKRIKYRLGGYYSDPYIKVGDNLGGKEFGVSAGLGLPIFQSKSLLSISGQYINVSPNVSGMLKENYLKINIGLTFNERWFMKWKVE